MALCDGGSLWLYHGRELKMYRELRICRAGSVEYNR